MLDAQYRRLYLSGYVTLYDFLSTRNLQPTPYLVASDGFALITAIWGSSNLQAPFTIDILLVVARMLHVLNSERMGCQTAASQMIVENLLIQPLA